MLEATSAYAMSKKAIDIKDSDYNSLLSLLDESIKRVASSGEMMLQFNVKALSRASKIETQLSIAQLKVIEDRLVNELKNLGYDVNYLSDYSPRGSSNFVRSISIFWGKEK